jgi:hypothetical protein
MPFLVVGANGTYYESEWERDLYEEASLHLSISVLEIAHFVRALLMVESDPIRALGAGFKFPKSKCWINNVPAPDAKVDLFECWERMRDDDRACVWTMKNKPTNADVLKVMANQLAWMRFAAARWPAANGRKAFHALTELQEATIQSLIEKGRTKRGAQEVVGALEEMLAQGAVQ